MAATTKIEIENLITVGTLAEKLSIPVSGLITELMKNGVMATVNEKIDFDTAQIIVGELGLDYELVKKTESVDAAPIRHKPVSSNKAQTRPPVVAVMGHVDHGKTSLLDKIMSSEVASHEAGGITQHISAYQITHNGRGITFLDTPGHEAFAAIREHGAQLTDIVIIVIAADDGIKPQTLEAIRFARKAGARIIVAINKIDKEGADANRVKQQMAENDLLVEEWGGDTVVQEVSAKTGAGIKELLDMVLLVADIEELKADYDVPAQGLIIESHVETGKGPVGRALVEQGTLNLGDYIVAGSAYAKVRSLQNSKKENIKSASPSTPVIISGFKTLPEFGDEFLAYPSEKEAKSAAIKNSQAVHGSASKMEINSTELIRMINRQSSLQELNVILKADVQGSLTSAVDSLKALDTEEVMVRFVGTGVGLITENDLYLAKTSNAIVYGFNVHASKSILLQAERDKVSIRAFNIIYELIDDVKNEMSDLLAPQIVETTLGNLSVKGVFKTTRTEIIAGGEVVDGHLEVPALCRIFRAKEQIAEAEVVSLKRGPLDAKEIQTGEMCGISLSTKSKIEIQEGDRIEVFSRESVTRTL